MARKKLKSATDQRKFTIVYNDFLESDLLNYYEKMVFITLKKFSDNETMRTFPSLKTIHNITGISLSQVRRSIEHMEELGVLSIEHRTDKDRGNQSNLYTLYDYAELWNVDSSKNDEMAAVVDEISEAKMVAELRARGYTVTKEKEPGTTEPTKDQLNQALVNQSDMVYTTINATSCQAQERYTLDDVKDIFGYEAMVHDAPELKSNIDSVMDVLHDALNTTADNLRINKKDVPGTVARKKLLELTNEEILFVVRKYRMQTGKINNPSSYILTQLFNAHRDMDLELTNKIQQQLYE